MVIIYIGANEVLQKTSLLLPLIYTTLLHSLSNYVPQPIQRRFLNFEFLLKGGDIDMPIKLTKRIENLERQLNVREKVMKLWDVQAENDEKQIADIIAGKVKNRDGSYFSEYDVNYFIDFDLFIPKFDEKGGKKHANTKN